MPSRSASRSASGIAYRPDIDGLRAIAIVLVVAFHFGVPGIAGGYLGVDLFFVISGFLIASIFERHPDLSPTTLAGFYARRVKRLLPAFVFVAAATILVATFLLLPEDYIALLRSVRDSLAFSANRYFEGVTTGYFAANAAQLPWLHAWSLSVEWQFYFAFPLVLLALRPLRSTRARVGCLLLLVVAGVALSTLLVAKAPAHAYFSSIARFFEFLTGVLAAGCSHASVGSPRWRTNRQRAMWVSALGVAALVTLALVFDAATAFPGMPAAVVCAIAFVMILAGRDGSLLSSAPFAWLGRRSYSIYLWHWPMVALANYVQLRPSPSAIAVALVALVVLGEATYRIVERPGIALRWQPAKTFVVGCLVPYVCVAGALAAVRHHDGFAERLGPEAARAEANIARFASPPSDRCHDAVDANDEACAFGDLDSSTQALMIGDSHARHFRPFVEVFAKQAHVRVLGLTNSECPTLEGVTPLIDKALRAGCRDAITRDYALIRSGRFRYVVIAERWFAYEPADLAMLERGLRTIVGAGAIPVVIEDTAEDNSDPHECFYHHIKVREPFVGDCSIRRDNAFAAEQKARVAALMRDMRQRFPSLIEIDPQAIQCRADTCETVIDDTPIYTDTHHLNAFGATMLARAYLARFGNPLIAGSTPEARGAAAEQGR